MIEETIKQKVQKALGKNVDRITRLENVPVNKVWFVSADGKDFMVVY